MVDLNARLDEVIAILTDAGVRAVVDGRDLNPPCVQIRPPTLRYRFGRGCTAIEWTARVIAPDLGTRPALELLGPLVERVQQALGYAATDAVPDEFRLADGNVVPAYVLTWSTRP